MPDNINTPTNDTKPTTDTTPETETTPEPEQETSAISQEKYEERITELDKREKALDAKLKRMESLNDKITAEGKATGGSPPAETAGEKQKKTLVNNFGGCIEGLDKMI